MKRALIIMSIFSACTLLSCSKATETKSPTGPTSDDGVQLVMWNDYHSTLYESVDKSDPEKAQGGLPVWMSAVEALKGDGLSIVLDAGDMFQGATPLNETKGVGMVNIMNQVGLDVATFGNHEFDFGASEEKPDYAQSNLTKAIALSQFKWINANVVSTEEDAKWPPKSVVPYTILHKGPYKIAVTAVSTVETKSTTNAQNIVGLEFLSPAQTLAKVIPEIVEKKPDFIIVLGHLTGEPSPMPKLGEVSTTATFSDELGEIMALPDDIKKHIGLLVTGHLHISFMYDDGTTFVTQGKSAGKELTTMKLKRKKGEKGLYIDRDSVQKHFLTHEVTYQGCNGGYKQLEQITAGDLTLKPDQRAYDIIKELESSMKEGLCDVMACTTAPFVRDSTQESAIGDLFAQATHSVYPSADAALLNSGGLRVEWPQGDLTRELVSSMMPFDNTAVLAEISGQELVQILKIASTGHHGVMQVDNITYSYQPNCGREPEDINTDGVVDSWESSCLCDDVTINGKPVDLNARYTVVMSDFIFNGGDSLNGIFKTSKRIEEGPVIRKALMDYVSNQKACFDPNTFVDPNNMRVRKTTCSSFMK